MVHFFEILELAICINHRVLLNALVDKLLSVYFSFLAYQNLGETGLALGFAVLINPVLAFNCD